MLTAVITVTVGGAGPDVDPVFGLVTEEGELRAVSVLTASAAEPTVRYQEEVRRSVSSLASPHWSADSWQSCCSVCTASISQSC